MSDPKILKATNIEKIIIDSVWIITLSLVQLSI